MAKLGIQGGIAGGTLSTASNNTSTSNIPQPVACYASPPPGFSAQPTFSYQPNTAGSYGAPTSGGSQLTMPQGIQFTMPGGSLQGCHYSGDPQRGGGGGGGPNKVFRPGG